MKATLGLRGYAAAITAAVVPCAATGQTLQVETIALTGQQAPGTPPGVVFASFGVQAISSHATINNDGVTTFYAKLTGPSVTTANDDGAWKGAPGLLELVMREGSPTGQPGAVFSVPTGSPKVDDAGGVALLSNVIGGGFGLFYVNNSSVLPVAIDGQQAPLLPQGVEFAKINGGLLTRDGRILFRPTLEGPGITSQNNVTVWSGTPDAPQMIARTGDPAPGLPGLVLAPPVSSFAHFAGGSLFFRTSVAGPGVTTANDECEWIHSAGQTQLVRREGELIAGLPIGLQMSSSLVRCASDGRVMSPGTAVGPGVTPDNEMMIAVLAPGVEGEVLAREGDPAPGLGVGVVWEHPYWTIERAGAIALVGIVRGEGVTPSNKGVLYGGSISAPAPFARTGDPAPGTPAGVVFSSLTDSGNSAWAQALNARRDMVFTAIVSGPGVGASNDRGLWAANTVGSIRHILREGDSLEVTPGDVRAVSSFTVASGSNGIDGYQCGLDDEGRLVFFASFTDGSSGVFRTTLDSACYPDCNASGALTVADFGCFQGKYVLGCP